MMISGLKKTAGILDNARALAKGVRESSSSSIRDTLKLRGLKEITKAKDAAGGLGHFIRKGGPEAWQAVGRAAPSLAAAGVYGVMAKKIHDSIPKKENREPEYLAPY